MTDLVSIAIAAFMFLNQISLSYFIPNEGHSNWAVRLISIKDYLTIKSKRKHPYSNSILNSKLNWTKLCFYQTDISIQGFKLMIVMSNESRDSIMSSNLKQVSKGQIISECPYEIIVYPKIATKKFPRFLSWKFTTSRLTQKESLCSVCKKIDSVLY